MKIYSKIKPGYEPKWFKPYELVPKFLYDSYGASSLRFLDNRILWTIDKLRDRYGVIVCNDWKWGGQFDSRGYRPPNDPDGSNLSAHKRSMAVDLAPVDITAEEIRQDIKQNKYPDDFKFITLIEDNVNWLHISCENVQKLTVINP
jgi:hypothetical protein